LIDLSVAEVVDVLGARIMGDATSVGGLTFPSVSIDSRTIQRGECFVAFEGKRFNGHDFVEEALALTQERAEKAGVNVELIEADVEGWRENRSFDLIIDTGLMHTIHLEKIDAYRSVVMQNLKSGGDFVLSHWINLSSEMRVNLKSAEQIAEFFSPDLRTIECKPVEFGSAALTMGFYWMKKN